MSNMIHGFQIGEWVKQYSKGLWVIADLKPKYATFDIDTDYACWKKGDHIGYWALLKKGFNSKNKFQISCDICDIRQCKKISDTERSFIKDFFNTNPLCLQELEKTPYVEPIAVTSVYINATPNQFSALNDLLCRLPKSFSMSLFNQMMDKNQLSMCITKPPTNYVLLLDTALTEVDEEFNSVYRNPRLIELKQKP